MLRGEPELDPDVEEQSGGCSNCSVARPMGMSYAPPCPSSSST